MLKQGSHKPAEGVSAEVPVQPAEGVSLEKASLFVAEVEGYRDGEEVVKYPCLKNEDYYQAKTTSRYRGDILVNLNTQLEKISGLKPTGEVYYIDCTPVKRGDIDFPSSWVPVLSLNKIDGYQINIPDNNDEMISYSMIIQNTDSNRIEEIYKNLLKKLAEGSILADTVNEVAKEVSETGIETGVSVYNSKYGTITIVR
ncbi:MAG: hypothetical protein ACOX2O_01045 [Bdellovibrionota bacterium]|jgi:hypothetical protein